MKMMRIRILIKLDCVKSNKKKIYIKKDRKKTPNKLVQCT